MRRRRADDGQILVLFALMLVVLFGMAALAIDVSNALAARRAYRTAADAAALAGAQELQQDLSRAIGVGEYNKARNRARDLLGEQVGGAPVCTSPSGSAISCTFTGTPYVARIRTPIDAGDCVSCAPDRSVEVKLGNPTFGLTFARVLGFDEFDVSVGAVAGLNFEKSYAIITLRPPKALGSTFDVRDIKLDSSVVNVSNGDVGSNANMIYSGAGASMNLDNGFYMYYWPAMAPDSDPGWYPSLPIGKPLTEPIQDPNYRYPSMSGAPTFDDARASQHDTLDAVERADVDTACADEVAKVDTTRYAFLATVLPEDIYCYNPGIYESGSGATNATITIGTGEVGILKPGAYYLKSGLDVGGHLVGGYVPGQPGVAVMFDERGPGNCSGCVFSGNNALTIALNAGTKFPPSFGGGASATAAIDWAGQLVDTSSSPAGPEPPLPITISVRADPDCYVPDAGDFREPSGCNPGKNETLFMAGGGSLALEGVQYAPTDNVRISGGSSGSGRVGQIISWTLTYSGGTTINQEGPDTQGPGLLRLDGACTAPGTPCSP